MKTFFIGIGALIVILLIGKFISPESNPTSEIPKDTRALKTYNSPVLGISFNYPENYLLTERNTSTFQRKRTTITLVDNTETNRQLLNGEIVGEGPTAINIDIIENISPDVSLENWIKSSNDSNWKLGERALSKTKLGNLDALRYPWSGLYEGETVAALTKSVVYMASVTWMTPQDRILSDYEKIIDSIIISDN